MENGPFIDDFPIKTSIHNGFSMAMLNNQIASSFALLKAGYVQIVLKLMLILIQIYANFIATFPKDHRHTWKLVSSK